MSILGSSKHENKLYQSVKVCFISQPIFIIRAINMKKSLTYVLFVLSLATIQMFGCSSTKKLTTPENKEKQTKKTKEPAKKADKKKEFEITSPKLPFGRLMPRKYTCQGGDVSPPFVWANPPEGTQSFTMILDDPDSPSGDWVHWIMYNLPADTRNIPESIVATPKLPEGGLYGKNSWGKLGYKGPCPPSSTHRYLFKLYAVKKKLDLPEGATMEEVMLAMQDNIISKTEFLGLYNKD